MVEMEEAFSIRDANGFRLAWVYFDPNALQSAPSTDTLSRATSAADGEGARGCQSC